MRVTNCLLLVIVLLLGMQTAWMLGIWPVKGEEVLEETAQDYIWHA